MKYFLFKKIYLRRLPGVRAAAFTTGETPGDVITAAFATPDTPALPGPGVTARATAAFLTIDI